MNENFEQEFDLNLKEAYRQLGYSENIPKVIGRSVYSAQVITTGWYNVDKYVFESTTARTTLDYTDPQTGKKAVINYNPVSIQINQWKEYDRIYVYLLPDKLNSFMRLTGVDGKYSEKLNELMKYGMVCIGYKDEQAYFYSQEEIQAKDYSNVNLTMIAKDDLNKRLNSIQNQSQVTGLRKENDYFQFNIMDAKRQKHNVALQQLTDRLIPIIFPCYLGERWADAQVANKR